MDVEGELQEFTTFSWNSCNWITKMSKVFSQRQNTGTKGHFNLAQKDGMRSSCWNVKPA